MWHLVTSAFVLCDRRGTYGTGLALVAALVGAGSVLRRAFFAWQAWHLVTSAPSLCVAGVALGDIHVTFVGQAWHLRHWAGSGGGLRRRWVRVTPQACGTCGTGLALVAALVSTGSHASFAWQAWHLVTSAPSLCVAGVALGDIHVTFVWQAWHLRHWAGSGGGLGRHWVRVTPRLFCVAGVALGDICLRFVWRGTW
eukprot:s133_g5.t1